MLKMMVYKEANSVLNSALTPDKRCISKGVGKDNGADWKDTQDHTSAMTTFMNRNGGASLFPDMRSLPLRRARSQEGSLQPRSCVRASL